MHYSDRKYYNLLVRRYRKYRRRLDRIDCGIHGAIGRTKNRQWLLKSLQELYYKLTQLQRQIAFAAGSMIVASTLLTSQASAQCTTTQAYVETTGASNPLNGFDIGVESRPEFVDIDNDGDFDVFVGEGDGTINYFENTGSASSPNFVGRIGVANPLNGYDVGTYSHPSFVDIDNDGDFDMFGGEDNGTIHFYENTGDASNPTFVERTGGANPMNGFDVGSYSTVDIVDIDGDGDFDMFVGEGTGIFNYFENTGTMASPTFVQRTGGANPLNGEDVGFYSTPEFVDIDSDGDFDMFAGDDGGIFNFFENTGTNLAPNFVATTGGDNPLDGQDVGTYSAIDFVDIDNDGDIDAFGGERTGIFNFFSAEQAPKFVEMTGASNPLDGDDVGSYSVPEFVDIDNDGDFDMFAGENTGIFNYYENTGTPAAAAFTLRTGGLNPLNGQDVGSYSAPAFVDIDNDGDFDMFAGENAGIFNYFENTGSAASPTFVLRTGGLNPLNGEDVGTYSIPTFVDIDDDGDFDMFAGVPNGTVRYWENTGSAASATFIERTGGANPMNGFDVGFYSYPEFVDLDRDGDFDLFVGESNGTINYFENTGTAMAATFVEQTGGANPMNGEDVGSYSAPAVVILDADADWDLYVGENGGIFNLFEDTCDPPGPPLPIELLAFDARVVDKSVHIDWTTASEINNAFFTVERSLDGNDWESIAYLEGAGTSSGSLSYSYIDESPFFGLSFYRLRQTDYDGSSESFKAISVSVIPNDDVIRVYPNPTANNLHINIFSNANSRSVASITIHSLTGQEVLHEANELIKGDNAIRLDLSAVKPGVYVINVNRNLGFAHQQRIIIQ